jgi:type IV pilus assembly protein PilC
MGGSIFFRQNWLPILAALFAGGFTLGQWRRTENGARWLARVKLSLPLVGPIFHQTAFSEFCRSLSILLSGGIPVVVALQNSVSAVGNAFIRERLVSIIGRVREGAPLNEALEATGLAPQIATDMIRVGEATGSLDEMLSNASDFLDQAVDTRLQRILSLLEPIMLVLMGAIVAILLVAIYLPLFSLLGQVRA